MADTFARMKQLVGTTAEWAANDIVLGEGEIGVERIGVSDHRAKCGDGVKTWSQLPYLSGTAAAVDAQVAAASAHAATATTQAGIATAQATSASSSAAAASARLAFWQGAKTSDPATRNDTTALQTGDQYFNTTNDRMRVYEVSTGWIDYEATAQAAATTATTQAGIATTKASEASDSAATATTQAATATTQAGLATTARTAAETARDAAFVNADVYASTAAGLAAVADGVQFQVLGTDEIIRYVRTNSTTATEVARYPASSIREHAVEPFPLTDWAEPVSLLITATPSSGLTAGTATYTIGSSGRFYCVPTISTLGFAVGDTVRVAFRRISGSGQPAQFSFYNGATLISSVPFVLRGGWYSGDGVIPSGTTIIRIDWTNGTGASVVISRPRFARRLAQQDLPFDVRTRLRTFVADGGDVANLWTGALETAVISGSGSSSVSGQNITVTAGAIYEIRSGYNTVVRANGSALTVLVKTSHILLSGGLSARFVGATTGTQTVPLSHVGDGWWLVQNAIVSTADPVGIGRVFIVPDNRAGTPSVQGFTAGDVTIGPIYVFDGETLPLRRPAPAADTYPDDEIVITQSTNRINLFQRVGGPDKYIQWGFTRYNLTGIRALGWRISALTLATRASATAFTAGTAIIDNGETELAIREVGKSNFAGGESHGNFEETRSLQLFVDGNAVMPNGSTTYRARRVEAIQKAQMWEVDNASRNLTATVVTRWLWERGTLTLSHRLIWARSINLTAGYMAMLCVLRSASSTAYRSTEYDAYDISAAGHAMPVTNASRMFTTGPIGVRCDIEITKGWTTNSGSFAEDTASPVRNKMYFSICPIGGSSAVTAGSIVDWEAVYRISSSA